MTKSRVEFLFILGVIFIILGLIGFLVIVTSFDYELYNDIKDRITFIDEANIMKAQLVNTWITGSGFLLANLAIGAFFIALDRIALTLREILEEIREALKE